MATVQMGLASEGDENPSDASPVLVSPSGWRIEGLSVQDCTDYITTRLSDVGSDTEVFTRDAISMICEASLGTLRETVAGQARHWEVIGKHRS